MYYSEPSILLLPHMPNPEIRCFAPLDCHRIFCLTTPVVPHNTAELPAS